MSKSIRSFRYFTEDESAHYLAEHWPKGKLFAKRHMSDSYLYKLIKCMAMAIRTFSGDLYTFVKNLDIDQADELLEEWETSVKIPEDIPRLTDTEDRCRAIKCLISKYPVYNIDGDGVEECSTFEYYVYCLTGLEVTIRTSEVETPDSTFPLEFPFNFGVAAAYGNFLFTIEVPVDGSDQNNYFPVPFPVQFYDPSVPDATQELLDTVLERVVPSFCRWNYEAVYD